jgi:hypothetical protein
VDFASLEADASDELRIDTSVVHPARRYDYLLGGKDNFEATGSRPGRSRSGIVAKVVRP